MFAGLNRGVMHFSPISSSPPPRGIRRSCRRTRPRPCWRCNGPTGSARRLASRRPGRCRRCIRSASWLRMRISGPRRSSERRNRHGGRELCSLPPQTVLERYHTPKRTRTSLTISGSRRTGLHSKTHECAKIATDRSLLAGDSLLIDIIKSSEPAQTTHRTNKPATLISRTENDAGPRVGWARLLTCPLRGSSIEQKSSSRYDFNRSRQPFA